MKIVEDNKQKLKNSLVVLKDDKKKETSQKEFRDAILFENILKYEPEILIYDCKGMYFSLQMLKFLFLLANALYFYYLVQKRPKKNKWNPIYYGALGLFLVALVYDHRTFLKYYVNRVTYITKDQQMRF